MNQERGICWPAIRTSFHGKMSDYEWLTKMGLCHKCRRNKVAPEKKFCFECLEKIRLLNAKNYDSEKAKVYQKRRREIYEQKKETGICVRCDGKATHGLYCYEHYIKERRRTKNRAEKAKSKRHCRGLLTEYRKNNNLCLWCGNPAIPGKNCCEKHSIMFSEAGKKAAARDKGVRDYWKMQKSKNSKII